MHPGPVILSGYAHPMYDERLKHWRRETKRAKKYHKRRFTVKYVGNGD